MKRILSVIALAFAVLGSGPAWSASSKNFLGLVDRAIEAMGGAKALGAVKTVALRGRARHWEPEQSIIPDGEMRLAGDSKFIQLRDLASGAARTEWVRKLVYPAPREYRFTEIVASGIGYVRGIDTITPTGQSLDSNPPEHAMSGLRVAAALRELDRTSPVLLLDMRNHPKRVSAIPDLEAAGKKFPAVRYDAKRYAFMVMFDLVTHLPARIRTLDADGIQGDSAFDLVLSDWGDAAGLKFPRRLAYELNGREVADYQVEEITVNPQPAADAFEIPAKIRSGAARAATAAVPYQWVIRRQYIGVFLDSDKINYDPQASSGLKLVDLAPGVSHAVGGTHNSLIVEMNSYLIVFDAPVNEWQSRWTIDAARARYGGKPVKYLVLTHHHMDHTSGTRTYIAEGARLVVGAGNAFHFGKVASAPHRIDNDELQRHPRPARIVEVADQLTISDGKREVGIYAIDNPHARGMLIGYVKDARLGFVTDLWSPGRERLGDRLLDRQAALVAAVKKYGIAPERFAGGHGTVGQYADLEAMAAKSR